MVVAELHYEDFQHALRRLRRRCEQPHLKHGRGETISVDDVLVDGFFLQNAVNVALAV
jgi:hypothetical protein